MAGVVDRLARALAARDVDALVACCAPDGCLSLASAERTWCGQDEVRAAATTLFAAFPDLVWRPRARWLDAGRTVEEGTWTGTHGGDLGSWAPATGRRIELRGRVFVTHDEQHARSVEVYTDLVGLRLAVGLPVTAVAEAADTSRLAGTPDRSDVQVFIRPEDPPQPAPGPRRPTRRRLVPVLVVVLAVLISAGVIVRDLPEGSSTTTTAGPQEPADTSPTAGPAGPQTSTGKKPRPRSGVVERGNNLDLSTDVLFARSSAVLSRRARGAIAEAARVMRARGVRGMVQINGYTDNLGSAAYGMTLSRQRARAVAAALRPQLQGVQVTLRPHGFGEADPVASNATEAGRQRNRRVTIVLPQN